MDEAYPFVAKMLLTDETPRLRAALKYMVYGKDSVFDADRLIDLLAAFEDFSVAAKSARGDMDVGAPRPGASFKLPAEPGKAQSTDFSHARSMSNGQASTSTSTSTGYSQSGGMSRSARAGSRPYSSNGNGTAAGRSTYTSYGAVPSAYGPDNMYTANMNNMPQQTESTGLAQFGRQVSDRNEADGISNSNDMRFGTGTDVRPHSGQGRAGGSERANSGQDASSAKGGPWGSWGSWPPQVSTVQFFPLVENHRLGITTFASSAML